MTKPDMGFGVLKLVKRDKLPLSPKPVFFSNAQGDLRDISDYSARQIGVDAAKSALAALAESEHAPI